MTVPGNILRKLEATSSQHSSLPEDLVSVPEEPEGHDDWPGSSYLWAYHQSWHLRMLIISIYALSFLGIKVFQINPNQIIQKYLSGF